MSESLPPEELERQVEQILDRLVRDVESAIHAMYRGSVRQQTMRVRSDAHRRAAQDALLPLLGVSRPAGDPAAASGTASDLASDEIAAISRCITAWLPMGAPGAASPQSRCVPAAREIIPTWGEREKAREALRRAQGGGRAPSP